METIKTYLIALLALFIVALSTCNGCKSARIQKLETELQVCNSKPKPAATIAATTTDSVTVIVPEGTGITLAALPQDHITRKVFPYIPVKSDAQVDTSAAVSCPDSGEAIWRYNELLDHYARKRVFTDTGKVRGVVFRNNVYLSNNYVDSIRTFIDSVPRTYITNTVYKERKSIKGYFTLTAQGNRIEPLQGFGGGFMLQLKSNNAFEGSAIYNLKTPLPDWSHTTFQVSYKHFITFRKF